LSLSEQSKPGQLDATYKNKKYTGLEEDSCEDDDDDADELPYRIPVGVNASKDEIAAAAEENLLNILLERNYEKEKERSRARKRRRAELMHPFDELHRVVAGL
jgi:hypothetical protein